ncbi:MAG: ABC transporter ATP-binding protein [Leptolyngbya sp.]|nr:MAG: ABC transporter ATP-binding protein [Leptolyngbya sp.]
MKYAVFLQHNEADCGAACLGAIAKHYGQLLSLNRLREAVGTGQQGTTLLGLQRGADALGFNARSVKASPEILQRLNEAPLPAVIHWQGNHWVVFYGKRRQQYVIADPAIGLRYLSEQEFCQGWMDWVMLLVEPDAARFSTDVGSDRPSTLHQLGKRLWTSRSLLAQVLVLNLILGLLSIALPFLIQILTDDVLVRGDLKLLNAVAIAVVLLSLFSSGIGLVQSNLTAYFAQRLELGLILEFGRAILNLPLTYYETHRSGEVVSRLQDIQALNQLVAQVVIGLPSQVFIALVSLSFMTLLSIKLTISAVLVAFLMTLSTILFLPTLQQKTRNLLILDAENQGVLVETFKGSLTLKTTAATTQFWEELQTRFGRLATLSFRTNQIAIANTQFSGLVSSIGGVALLWFGSTLVISKELSIGQLLAFSSLNSNFTGLISTSIRFVDEFARVRTATERLTEVIDHTSELENKTLKPSVEISSSATIQCDQISFHYPGRVELLDSVSLYIPGGKAIALMGKSGCGKSTVAKLLAGLYPLQAGNIRVGAYNLADLALECVRRQVVLVPQESHLWSRSILENFQLGNPGLSFEAIVQACQVTGADEFISRLPDKYQTVLGEFGANLSGGQRQRLAIARAILFNPPILILDESTASLDPEAEAQILDRLLTQRQGKTTILISHRDSVINRSDWVILLDQGKLRLEGTSEQLRTQLNLYFNFKDSLP